MSEKVKEQSQKFMTNLSGSGNWIVEDPIPTKAKTVEPVKKEIKEKELVKPNFETLDKLINEVQTYYDDKALKHVGDLLLILNSAKKLSEFAFTD